MRFTKVVNAWREAATVMMFARRTPRPPTPTNPGTKNTTPKETIPTHPASAKYDYRLLMLERSSKSSFMPSAYVFPGGAISDADFSADWLKFYKEMGVSDVNNSIPDPQQSPIERAPMFTRPREWPINSDIAFRICSIRETFEEAGILLCKHKHDLEEPNKKQGSKNEASSVDTRKLQEWRPVIQKDASKFIDMCQQLEIVPDVWSLYEWSCWLTPTNMEELHSGKRFDTAFYICGLPEHVDAVHDQQEIVSSKWVSVPDMLSGYYGEKLWIAPPQIYEMSRLGNIKTFESLQNFSAERQSHGCVRWLPVRMTFNDGIGTVLPGDDLYPTDVDWEGKRSAPEINETYAESASKAKNLHRFEFRSYHDSQLLCGIPPANGHAPPMPLDEILQEQKSQL